jgi:hypothetical protein
MRSAAIVAILVTSAALMAGCSGKGKEDDHSYTCPNGTTIDLEKYPDHHNSTFSAASHCPHSGTTSHSNSTSLPPNQLPMLHLKISDGGNVTNVTMLNGNLTFDAAGSMDPDGSVTGIAVTIQDSNTTRTAALFDPAKKTFKTATFKFDRPGVVNVTVAMVDDRAGFTVNQTHVYVDQLQTGAGQTVQLPGGSPTGDECNINNAIVGAQFYKEYSFNLVNGATLIEAIATGTSEGAPAGDISLTICSPEHVALGEPGNPTVTTGGPFPAPTGIASYYVGITISGGATTNVVPTVLVHYEPGAAATFAAAA